MSSELGFSANKRRLLERLLRKEGLSAQTAMTIPRRSADAVVPVSFAQQRLWFLEQLDPGNVAYNLGRGLRLTGTLDIAALEQSLNAIVARHEVLRTTFAIQDGEPIQIIAPALTLPIEQIDLTDLPAEAREAEVQRIANADFLIPFDLTTGPLIRAKLLRLADDTHAFFLTNHHIVSDALSMGVMIQEFTTAYQSFSTGQPLTLAELPIQYADFSVWQRQELQGQKLEQQLDYWRQQLAGLTPLDLRTDYPRPAVANLDGALTTIHIDPTLADQLRALSRANSATLFMTLLAAWQVLLSRYSNQHDIAVGTPIAGRNRPELERLIGFFVNTLVLRTDLSDNPTVHELLQRVRATTLAAYAHQDLPFEAVVQALQPERDLSRSPLFQVMFSLQTETRATLDLPGLAVQPLAVEGTSAKFDLTLTVSEGESGLHAAIQYRSDLFAAATIERMAAHFQMLLDGFVANADQRIGELTLLTPAERQQVLQAWIATTVAYAPAQGVHRLVEDQADHNPGALALITETQRLTYTDLNDRANQIAHYLRQHGIGPDVCVGVYLPRSQDFVIAALAVLKAGGAYLPLDPGYPAARLEFMLRDARARVLLTHSSLSVALVMDELAVVALDRDATEIDQQPTTNPDLAIAADQLAYVIYTSGSTGTPKGVEIPHRGLLNLLRWHQATYALTSADRASLLAGLSFDASVWELWPYLTCGASLAIPPEEVRITAEGLTAWLAAMEVTIAFLPTPLAEAALSHLRQTTLPLRALLTGGDLLHAYDWATLPFRVINHYGPTENSVVTTAATEPAAPGLLPPIGRPIANTQVYLLDVQGQPVPVGVPGELYVGGIGLARGYRRRADLTAERFVPDPFSATPGGRLYRTGDLARWLPDGQIEFLGRRDQQVKLRGFRIEIGEIEAVLQQHPDIGECVVVVRDDVPGDKRLVAYVVENRDAQRAPGTKNQNDETDGSRSPGTLRVGHPVLGSTLREFLAQRLPDYMVPSAFVALDTLPLTPNGKVDRRALPTPDVDADDRAVYVAPSTAVEVALAQIWAEVLHVERVGIHDNFFALGGHSLLATQVVSRVRTALNVELPVRALFEQPTIAALAQVIAQQQPTAHLPPLRPRATHEPVPLSFAQQRLWFIDQLQPGSASYHAPMALMIHGPLDVAALEASLAAVVARHESLRTRFVLVDETPMQVIVPQLDLPLPLIDLSQLDATQREEAIRQYMERSALEPFDLTTGPLLRTTLIRCADDAHVLLLTQHHIVTDGWSLGLLIQNLTTAYLRHRQGQPAPLPALPIQYPDYALWQRDYLQGAVLEQQLGYWRRQLAGLAPLDLPTDRPRPPVQTHAGAALPVRLDRALTERLRKLSRSSGTSLFMTLLAAWQVLLSRYSNQHDIAVGTPIAGRTQPELEQLIGFFVNTLVLRADLSDNPSFIELLQRVRATTLEAYAHQDLPFEFLVEELQPERDMSRQPLAQVLFALQNAPLPEVTLPEIQITPLSTSSMTAKFDLTFNLLETEDGLLGSLEYATALFDPSTITRMLHHYRQLLLAFAADPAQPVLKLPLLTTDEQQQLIQWINPAPSDFSTTECLHIRFTAQATATPEAIAVVYDDQRLTYRELDRRANQLARYLLRYGVEPGSLVGLCVERSLDVIVGVLGILKAGGAYVPLDPSAPSERLSFMLQDTRAPVLVTQEHLRASLPESSATVLCLDTDWPAIAETDGAPMTTSVTPQHPAYVIYTSGSTGQPKGVLISHAHVDRLFLATDHWFHFDATDVWTLFHSYAFDFSVWEIWGALLYGGRLVVVPYLTSRAPEEFYKLLQAEQVTVLNQTPSAFRQLQQVSPADETPLTLRYVIFGGEALEFSKLRPWFDRHGDQRPHLINMYGITETTVHVTYRPITQADLADQTGSVIGQPIPDLPLYVLDAFMQPAPIGVVGEIYVGGAGVADGYLNRPTLTAERFVPDPFGRSPGARLYKSGDLARVLPGGELQYIGRADSQVKVRGFRIELGEIESALVQHPDVRDAVVLARQDSAESVQLVAYVVPKPELVLDLNALRSVLQASLPDYMVPSVFVPLESLPLTGNGKVDRRALPVPEGRALDLRSYSPPRTPIEEIIAGIWARVLNRERVGIYDNFFELGGHSLLATRIITQIRAALNVDVPLRVLFETTTLAELAERVVAAQAEQSGMGMPPLTRADRDRPLPLSFAQQRLWFIHQLEPESAVYHIPIALRLTGPLDIGALQHTINLLIERHESLRTSFALIDGQPVQQIHPALPLPLHYQDLRDLPLAESEDLAMQQATELARRPFDLERGPLLRAAAWQIRDGDALLLIVLHHIISDGWSLGVLVQDFTALYGGAVRNEPADLPALPIQYPDFAVWQRDWLQGDVLEQQLGYWRQQLTDLPTLNLPTDYPRPAVQSYHGEFEPIHLDLALTQQLRELSRQTGTTLFMVLVAAWQTLLARYSGQDDLAIGIGIAGRSHVHTDNLIGFFVNTLVLRTRLDGDPTVREMLERARTTTLDAYAHQDIPFEYLVEQLQPERDLSRQPLFQVMIVLQNTPKPIVSVADLQVETLSMGTRTAKFDLTLDLTETPTGLSGFLEYATDLFAPATIERMAAHFTRLVQAFVANPDARLADLDLLLPAERHQILHSWNATAVPLPPLSIPAAFARQVARTPDALALISAESRLTYAALDAQANALAHELVALGVGPETRVGLCLERSPDLIIAILATLKAGGVYVPLDPAYPPQRLALMLEDAGAAVLIARPALSAALPATGAQLLVLDPATSRPEAAAPPRVACDPAQVAYVMYTSGSTGTPKGVAVPHQAVLRLIHEPNFLDLSANDVLLHMAPAAFDASTLELWGALLTGARLVLAPPDLPSLETIAQLLRTYHVSVLWLTAGLFHLMVDQHLAELVQVRRVLAGGDVLSLPHVQRFLAAGGYLINGYGPTENTTFTTCYPISAEGALGASVPIGRPITNTTVYVLDGHMQPVPVGVPGELYTGGFGLARGYLNRPALTAERFVPHPFSAEGGARLYRTGDLARWRPDGTIEFLGRRDHQVKLRGYRIELGEIEAVLQQHPQVSDALVMLRRDRSGDARLVGYLVPETTTAQAEVQAEYVQDWQTLYDQTYGGAAPADPTFHIVGWHSSYTGQPIPDEEMREWRDATVSRIRALKPKRVLEIGCGTGLLLFPLAGDCERYHGIDFSAPALAHIQHYLPSEWTHVTLAHQLADAFPTTMPDSVDTVIINSVIQYFPSVEYLLGVISEAVARLVPGGHIFMGDIRSRPLLEAFSTAIVLAQAAPDTPSATLRQQVERLIAQERELVLDPAFFHALRQHLPRISDVQVEIKRGIAHNELTQFRYDVTLTVEGPQSLLPEQHLDWEQDELTLGRLRAALRESDATSVLVRQIPSARVQSLVQATALLRAEDRPDNADAVLAAAEIMAAGVDPEALWALAEELGYAIRIGWSEGGASGHYEAILSRVGAAHLPPPAAATPQPWAAYATAPAATLPGSTLERQVREYAQTKLPEYMIPPALVVLPAFPLTVNGKVDRAALPAPRWGNDALGTADAPQTPVEALLVDIWQIVLGLDQVGIHDHFFDLGGHSLLATQVVSRVRTALNVELPVRALFEQPTIAALAQVIAQQHTTAQLPPLRPRATREPVPLSFAQQRLWFIDQLQPGSASYHVPAALTIRGSLNMAALEASLAAVVARHESLRTRFVLVDETPMQVVVPQLDLPVTLIDLSHLSGDAQSAEVLRLAHIEAITPFDLATGPLLRTTLIRCADDAHVLLLTQHHIITDGWSLGLLIQDLTTAYLRHRQGQPAPLPALPIQYPDYALWQRDYLQGAVLEQQLGYWRRQLAGLAPLDLPTDRPRPPMQSHRGTTMPIVFDQRLAEQLHGLSRASGTSLFMTLLAAWQVLLSRSSGQTDIAVGTPIAGRTHAELEQLIGFFVNTLVLRADLSDNPSFIELLQRVRATTLEAYAHQDLPFEAVVEAVQPERDMSRSPLFQVMFSLMNAPLPEVTLPEIQIAPLNVSSTTAMFDLSITLLDLPTGINGRVEYATDLFDAATISRLLEQYQILLAGIVADPNQSIATLPLLTEAERRMLVADRNATALAYPREQCLHQLVAAQVARTPDAVAVVFEKDLLHYGELDRRANQLAHHLQSLGVGPNVRVGLCLERGLDLPVALLGILKAGGCYVPLDPSYPTERLQFMVEDAAMGVLLLHESLHSVLDPGNRQVVTLDADWTQISLQPDTAPQTEVQPDDLAYVIYTSGSTGTPKGVQIPHRAIVNFLASMQQQPGLTSKDVLLSVTTIAFDIAGLELFLPLLVGARIVLARREDAVDGARLVSLLETSGATVLQATPATWRMLLAAGWGGTPGLRALCGGEALPWDLALALLPRVDQLWNLYGPTETTVWSAAQQVREEDGRVSLGAPIGNTQLYVVDEQLHLVPLGTSGELLIGGDGLARGYLGRSGLTAERFVPDPFGSVPGARLYRTGDRVRYRTNGTIEFLGRMDYQVKLRGYRIELGEIEAALLQQDVVREAVVVLREDRSAGGYVDQRLVAYVVVDQTARSDNSAGLESRLRQALGARMPEYMVPSVFVALDALPLTSNGKINRRALPAPNHVRSELAPPYVAPRTPNEEALAKIWAELLRVERVGIHDNFFALGGHSLLAFRLMEQIRKSFGRSLPLAMIFERPTIEQLALRLEHDQSARWSPLVPIQPLGSKPPLFCVHGLGGSVLNFLDLGRALAPEQPLYGLQGFDLDGEQEPHTRIEEMAAAYVEAIRSIQPQGPYFLSGWSLGGIIAFEMARQLRESGQQIALLAVLDSLLGHDDEMAAQDDGAILMQLAQMYGLRLDDPGILRQLGIEAGVAYLHDQARAQDPDVWGSIPLPALQRMAQLGIMQTRAAYRYVPQSYAGRISLFYANDNVPDRPQERAEAMRASWAPYADEGVDLLVTPGTHWSMLSQPAVQTLALQLLRLLEQAQEGNLEAYPAVVD